MIRFWSKVDIRGPDECWPSLRGESHGMSVLTDQQRRDIRANYLLCRVAKRALARRYCVSQQVIQYTLKGIRK